MATTKIAFVGWRPEGSGAPGYPGGRGMPIPDQSSAEYLRALEVLVATMRDQHENRPSALVTTQLRLAGDAQELRAHLLRPADLLIYGGHAVVDVDGSAYLASERGERLYLPDLRPDGRERGIDASGLVLDCCVGGHPDFTAALVTCLQGPTEVMACRATAPHTHGPVLLPILLSKLACPQSPPSPTPDTLEQKMAESLDVAPSVWGGQWQRWSVERLSPSQTGGDLEDLDG